MKILFVNSLYAQPAFGGAEKVVRTLAESLLEMGHEPVVVTLSPDGDERTYEHNGVRVRQLRLRNIYYPWPQKDHKLLAKVIWHGLDIVNPWVARRLGRILDEERPDLVHTHVISGLTVAAWAAIKRRRLPLVHSLHDVYLLCMTSAMFRNGQNCEKKCGGCGVCRAPHARYSRYVDVAIGVSEFILRKHLDYGLFGGSTDCRVVYNGYDPGSVGRKQTGRGKSVRFGFLANLAPYKGIEELLCAILQVPEDNWTLTIGGSGTDEYTRHLKSTYADRRISFLGYITPSLKPFYESIDVLVVPSIWQEPASLTITEALASGLPVIGSLRGGTPELIEEGRTGYLFEPGRPSEFVEALSRTIRERDRLPRLSRLCIEAARSRTIENMLARHMEVYGSLGSIDV